MNKNVIDNSISIAYEAINKAGISNNGRINNQNLLEMIARSL